jgi:hypothetical protein
VSDALAEEPSPDPWERLRVDPDGSPLFVMVVGRKGSGKSHFTRRYARSWPYDALIVDPTRDFDPDGSFTRPYPGGDAWPEVDPEDPIGHRRFRIVPNRRQKDHRERVAEAILLAHEHPEPTLVVVDEGRYLFASDQSIPAGADVVTNEGRHGPTFLFVDNPRAIGLRPILFHQADLVVVFALASDADIERVAEASGVVPDELADLIRNLDTEEGPHGETLTGFVLIDNRAHDLTVFPVFA